MDSSSTSSAYGETKASVIQPILSYAKIPKTFQSHAATFMHELEKKDLQGLSWDGKGNVFNNGEEVEGVNVLDVLPKIMSLTAKTDTKTVSTFLDLVKKAKLPKEFIRNPKWRKYYASSEQTTDWGHQIQ